MTDKIYKEWSAQFLQSYKMLTNSVKSKMNQVEGRWMPIHTFAVYRQAKKHHILQDHLKIIYLGVSYTS